MRRDRSPRARAAAIMGAAVAMMDHGDRMARLAEGYAYTVDQLRIVRGESPFKTAGRKRKKALAALNRQRTRLFDAFKAAGVWPLPPGIGTRIYALEDAATKKGSASARWAVLRRQRRGRSA